MIFSFLAILPFLLVQGRSLSPRTLTITESQILQVAPSASTCAGAPFPDECATATHAASNITAGLATYGITSAAEAAALVGWMAFESGEFKYNRNHYPAPGRPGQGTRNMQMPTFTALYAAFIPALQAPAAAITAGTPAADASALSTAQLDALLALVSPDSYSFASAAWFLTTQCDPNVRASLQAGGTSGWEAFVTECIDTTVTQERATYWEAAAAALGVGTWN